MIVGVPLRQQNDMSVEVRKDFRAPERVRNWLRLGLENHHFVYMRFGITPFENLKTKKKKSLAPVAYRHLDERYGPSFGFSLGLNSRMSVEAEYQPEFAFKDKTSYSRVNSRLGNAWRRIDRLDTFRIRFSLKLYSNQ